MCKHGKTSSFQPTKPLIDRTGFTLVELLVTITIVGVLAGITASVMGSVQQSSRGVKCVSNLKQLGAAAFSYAADNGEKLPNDGSNATLYPQLLWPYVYPTVPYVGYSGSTEPASFVNTIFHCPQAPYDAKTASVTITAIRSYGMNYYMGDGDPLTPERLALIPHPATTMLFCDSYNKTFAYAYLLGPRHAKRCNTVFCDGHAAPVTLTSTMVSKNNDPDTADPFWGDRRLNPNQ